jgi:hypothetical protein
MRRWIAIGFAAALLGAGPVPPAPAFAASVNDYPTAARADYVFACMETNGGTHQALERCSCSIDVIAELLPYDRYVSAETVARMTQAGGYMAGMFRDTAIARKATDDLRRAQSEAEVRCF